ncbi:MAG: hypothetical protein M1821_010065 [Bathelium mastoideum]|nr:MAG: hypothetical protein M1821_010065 [Bathelium mastoideum]
MSNQFPELQKKFVVIMRDELNDALSMNAQADGTCRIPLWDTVKHLASRINILTMFGEDVANNPVFVNRGLKYIDEVTLVSEAAKNLPSFLVPLVAILIRGRNLNQKHSLDTISSEIERHRENLVSAPESADSKPHSILEALVRNLPEQSQVKRIRFDMNTTFVSSTTATPILATHLLQDIFTHPEYLPALREEVQDVLGSPSPDMTKLPLLESFLVESIRTHCFLSTVIHRVPLKPFTFSDGYSVPKGEIVEFYQHRVMNDDAIYPNAGSFNPSRFKGTGRAATDMGMEWPFWGNSKLAW